MSISSTTRYRWIGYFLLLTSLLIWTEYAIVTSTTFQTQPDRLAWAISVDLLLGIPMLYYLLIVRPLSVTPLTLVAACLAAVGLANWLLPPTHRQYVHLAERALMLAEVGLVAIAVMNLRKIKAVYYQLATQQPDFIANLELALTEVVGRLPVLPWLVGEIAMLRYALLGPWLKAEVKPGQLSYTLYRESGVTALGITLLMVGGVETLLIHLLVIRWQETVAWVLFGLSGYSMLLVVSYLVSLRKRPTLLTDGCLLIRVGFFWRSTIRLANIAHIERIGLSVSEEPMDDLAKVVGSPPNLMIRLKEPVQLSGFYQRSRPSQTIGLFLDEPTSFVEEITKRKP